MEEICLDLRGVGTVEELHAAVAEALALPEHYGGNLDALYDCLCERTDDLLLRVLLSMGEDWPLTDYARRLAALLEDATDENPHLFALTEWVRPEPSR